MTRYAVEYDIYAVNAPYRYSTGVLAFDTWDTDGDETTVHVPADASVTKVEELPVGTVVEVARGEQYRIKSPAGWQFVNVSDVGWGTRKNEESVLTEDERVVASGDRVFIGDRPAYAPEDSIRLHVKFEVDAFNDEIEPAVYGFQRFLAMTRSCNFSVKVPEGVDIMPLIPPLENGIYIYTPAGSKTTLLRRTALEWQRWNSIQGAWCTSYDVTTENEHQHGNTLLQIASPM